MKIIVLAALVAAIPAAAVAAPTTYPLVLENCGIEARFDHAPQRAVGLGQNSTEIMLMLGLADRMAGSAIWVSPVLPELETENKKVERIANNTPNFEAVVARNPDFLAAQFLTAVGPKGRIGTREQFSDLGISSYVSPTDCATKDNTRCWRPLDPFPSGPEQSSRRHG